jgi:hypothetical protein
MKRIMEVNGVANIKLMMDIELDKIQDANSGDSLYVMNEETYKAIHEQCDLLVKYMRAYNDAINKNEQTPFWHDIKKQNNN